MYNVSGLSPACASVAANSSACVLDASLGGQTLVIQAPSEKDPANYYTGANQFQVEADQYTLDLNQRLLDRATIPQMMTLFGTVMSILVFCSIFSWCFPYDRSKSLCSATVGANVGATAVPTSTVAPAPSGLTDGTMGSASGTMEMTAPVIPPAAAVVPPSINSGEMVVGGPPSVNANLAAALPPTSSSAPQPIQVTVAAQSG